MRQLEVWRSRVGQIGGFSGAKYCFYFVRMLVSRTPDIACSCQGWSVADGSGRVSK